MSKSSQEIYTKHWGKMSKLIATISDAIKDYYKTAGESQLPDHELVLMSMQVFSLVCGKKWGYDQERLEGLWASSKDMHKLIQSLSNDVKAKGKMQEYAHTNTKQYTN